MGLRLIQCGRQTVRVIQPDGQVRQFILPMSVADLVGVHPHHYVCQATNRRGSILPLDAQLESGGIYLLLPLPRLFPTTTTTATATASASSSASSQPHPCSCFLQPKPSQDEETTVKCGPSIWMGRRHWGLNSCSQSSKISPEGTIRDGSGAQARKGAASSPGQASTAAVVKRTRLWEPSLEIILENDLLLRTKDEEASAAQAVKKTGHKKTERESKVVKADLKSKFGISPWRRESWQPSRAIDVSCMVHSGFIF